MKYVILASSSATNLANGVNEYIEAGWKPQGGVAYSMSMASEEYAQALVKE